MTLTCTHCPQSFTQKSSLVRHLKRCAKGAKAPPRQKACRQCAQARTRCDLQRPICGRCRDKDLSCAFPSKHTHIANARHTASQNEHEANPWQGSEERQQPESLSFIPRHELGHPPSLAAGQYAIGPGAGDMPPAYIVSPERRLILLGKAPNNSPSHDIAVRHTMHFVIRVLKSWPRLMASHHTALLPPPIHRLQVTGKLPVALENCYMLARMWAERTEGNRQLVRKSVTSEISRLIDEHISYNEFGLLAASQSLLMLVIILFFGFGVSEKPHPGDAQLLVQIWDVKHRLAGTGLTLDEETAHTLPFWRDWVTTTTKRRTILAFHHVEWAWSVLYGYPVLTCFELGPLPAPPAKHLWQETDEDRWRRSYADALQRWKGGFYRMVEFFHIDPSGPLDSRSELWLAEADEYGMMVMAEVNAVGDVAN